MGNRSATSEGLFGLGAHTATACVPFFGVWAMQVWIQWLNNKVSATDGHPWWFVTYFVSLLALALVAVAFSVRPSFERRARMLDCALTAVGTIGAVAFIALPTTPIETSPLVMAVITATALCQTWGYVRWGVFYARIGIRSATGCIFAGLIIGACLKTVMLLVPDEAENAIAIVLPALSFAMLSYSLKRQPVRPPVKTLHTERSLMHLWKPVTCIALYEFIYTFSSALPKQLTTSGGPAANVMGHAIEIAAACLFLWWVFKHHGDLGFTQLWRVILLLMGFLLVLYGLPEPAFPWEALTTSISYLVVVMIWLFISDVAHHSSINPYTVFSAGWLVTYVLPNYLGRVMGRLAPFQLLDAQMALVLVFVLALALAFLLETKDPVQKQIFADMNYRPDISGLAELDERCRQLAEHHGLTPRETEIMQLLYRGRSKAYIAETLFISDNTVRSHARRIYAKLGIHSKHELYDLIEK